MLALSGTRRWPAMSAPGITDGSSPIVVLRSPSPTCSCSYARLSRTGPTTTSNTNPTVFAKVCGLGAGRAVPYQQADRGHLVPTGPQHPDNVHRRCREASAVRSGWDVRGPGTPRRPCLIRHSVKPDTVPDQMLWLTTYSMLSMSFETSSGSIAGNIPTRSWLRPSLR